MLASEIKSRTCASRLRPKSKNKVRGFKAKDEQTQSTSSSLRTMTSLNDDLYSKSCYLTAYHLSSMFWSRMCSRFPQQPSLGKLKRAHYIKMHAFSQNSVTQTQS